MFRKLFPLVLFGLSVSPAFADGIEFFHGSFDEAVAQAAKTRKMVFVDVYTDWCAPCKKMAKTVFVLDDVGRTFNKHFVSYKLNAEDAAQKGPEIAGRFGVNSYPTYLFLDGSGKLIAQKGGAMSPEAFKITALTATGVADTATFCKDYEAGDRGIDAFVRCFSRKTIDAREYASANPEKKDRYEQTTALGKEYDEYFKTIPGQKLLSAEGFRLISNAPMLRRGDAGTEFLVTHYSRFAKIVDRPILARTVVEANMMGIMTGAFMAPDQAGQWVEDIRGVLADAYKEAGSENGVDPYEWDKAGLQSTMAMKNKDWPAFLSAEQQQAALVPQADRSETLASVGRKLLMFRCEDKGALRVGAGFVAMALDKKETFGNTVLYGELMRKLGDQERMDRLFARAREMIDAEMDEKKKSAMKQQLEKVLTPAA